MQRRSLIKTSMILASGTAFYPAKSIFAQQVSRTISVGFSAGGSSDGVARLLAEELNQRTKQNFIIENRAGANGRLAADKVSATPKGQASFLVAPFSTILFAALTVPEWKIDIYKDLKPVACIADYPLAIVVSPKVPANSLQELINWIKENPAQATFGTSGLGGHNHLLGVALGNEIKQPLQVAPYKGNAPLITDLLGGHVPFAVGVAGDYMAHADKLKILAVLTEQRSELMPDVPTAKELGVNITSGNAWYGLWASPSTAQAEIESLQGAVKEVLGDQAFKQKLASRYFVAAAYRSGEELQKRLKSEESYWRKVIKDNDFKPN